MVCKPYVISGAELKLMSLAGNIDVDYNVSSSDLYPRGTVLMTVIVNFNRKELNRNDVEDLVIGMFGHQKCADEHLKCLCAAIGV